jgi:hypothetical protein
MCLEYGLSKDAIAEYINIIQKYKSTFSISDNEFDTNNLGLIVTKNGIAKPCVWSGLRLSRQDAFASKYILSIKSM